MSIASAEGSERPAITNGLGIRAILLGPPGAGKGTQVGHAHTIELDFSLL